VDGKEVDKTESWVNSFDVYKFLNLETGKTYKIYPCAQKEGQEMEFELLAYSKSKVKLAKA